MERKYIGESICLVSGILEYIDSVLFSADFDKAFDYKEQPFILATLYSFGFGSQFIQWIRVILNNGESCIMNNGHSRWYFPIKQCCRHGSLLCAYLFIICVEVLFVQFCDNNEIISITINNHEIKLSAFVDRMTTSLLLTSRHSNLFLMHVQDFGPCFHSNLILKNWKHVG